MNKRYKICIIGAGTVGYATGEAFLARGREVYFVDKNKNIVNRLKDKKRIASTPEEVKELSWDVSFICVPTPNLSRKGIDLRYIQQVCKFLGQQIKKVQLYHVIAVKSSVVPGTTEKVIVPLLEKHSGKQVGKDFGVCVNPEYLRSNHALQDALNPWVIIAGFLDKPTEEIIRSVYKNFNCPFYAVSPKEAEMEKYVHNVFNATKIAFFNEMRAISKSVEINNIEEVLTLVSKSCEGIWNPMYGLRNFGPFGGKCLPKDVNTFLQFLKSRKIKTFIVNNILKENEFYKKFYNVRD